METGHWITDPWAGALLTVAQARDYLNRDDHFSPCVKVWRGSGNLVQISDDNVRFCDVFAVQRQADGQLVAFEQTDRNRIRQFTHLPWPVSRDWLVKMVWRKVELLYVEEIRRLTGCDFTVADLQMPEDTDCIHRSLNMEFGMRDVLQQAEQAFQQLMDEEACHLARKYLAGYGSMASYNLVLRYLPTWRNLEKQGVALLPLVVRACMAELITPDDNAVHSLKRLFEQAGMSPQTWETLRRMPVQQTAWLASHYPLPECLDIARHFAEAGGRPNADLLKVSAFFRKRRFDAIEIPPWFDRAAAIAMQPLKTAAQRRRFIENEYVINLDWLCARLANGRPLNPGRIKDVWRWITRQSDNRDEAPMRVRLPASFSWEAGTSGIG